MVQLLTAPNCFCLLASIESATYGVKLSYLLRVFTEKLSHSDSSPTVQEFINEWNINYLDSLRNKYMSVVGAGQVVGSGQVYIVCDLESKFQDVLVSIEDYFRATPDIFVCMDGITHCPSVPGRPGPVQFEKIIEEIGRLVLVITSTWNVYARCSVLHQSSALYEVYCAVKEKSNSRFDLALTLDDCALIKERHPIQDIEKYLANMTEDNLWKPIASRKICDRLTDLLSKYVNYPLSYQKIISISVLNTHRCSKRNQIVVSILCLHE